MYKICKFQAEKNLIEQNMRFFLLMFSSFLFQGFIVLVSSSSVTSSLCPTPQQHSHLRHNRNRPNIWGKGGETISPNFFDNCRNYVFIS